MSFANLDAYFHLASQGDTEAFEILYKEFVIRAKYTIKTTITTSTNYVNYPVDFSELIDEFFFKALNEFEPERGTFTQFCDYILTRRLFSRVKRKIYENQLLYADVSLENEEVDAVELLSDPNETSIISDIALTKFKYQIASPNIHRTSEQRLRDKILLLQYAGYQITDICKILKIPYSSLRREIEKFRTDEELINLKLDLK